MGDNVLTIRACTISELMGVSNFNDLLEEYAEESSIPGLPKPSAKLDLYVNLETHGGMYTMCALYDGVLIGYISVLAPVLPHYSALVAVTESFFVAKEHRKTGAGIKLLRAAEDYAKSLKSPGLLVSAPFGGSLSDVLPRVGYAETNRVFFKGFTYGE